MLGIFKVQSIQNAAHPQQRSLAATSGQTSLSSSLATNTVMLMAAPEQERRAGAGSRPDGLDTTQ
ncbi:hypothetical protein [Xanthomonas arboricola]|uniref:Uncharacterized protein n=1 Tax=Xanthomonas arboricola TaxID=56448 RepID=A0A2S7ABJ4_9XANT|nr:hypothetical protein [Xanthomonas arboricola]PPU06550.1 hypothetical protein XarjCFBP7645_18895 [Xanthomonas arboricola]